jgi:UDP-4-amino-4,6-dideoxy-N-acetyl-beta-L-altrosamine transaminase
MIQYGRQQISEDDIAAVVKVLRSDFLTQGQEVPKFESAICNYTGSSYGVAVNSGTSALHIACLALNLGKGDYLWTTPISFVASSNCGLYCGARVDFVDIDPSTWNISVQKLEEKLAQAKINNKLPKVVVVVHLCGLSCDLIAINKLSIQYGFSVIEDASHALGGKYNDQPIGSGLYSEITTFSFHPVKSITTGEGGMAVTNNKKLAERMRLLRTHGITKSQMQMTRPADGKWYYQQIALGFNYRISDIHAALGVSQLQRLNDFIKKRSAIAKIYNDKFQHLPLQRQFHSANTRSAHHIYVIRVDKSYRKKAIEELHFLGIHANVHYIPIYAQPFYQEMGFKAENFPESEAYYDEAITIPIHPGMSDENINEVVEKLSLILKI